MDVKDENTPLLNKRRPGEICFAFNDFHWAGKTQGSRHNVNKPVKKIYPGVEQRSRSQARRLKAQGVWLTDLKKRKTPFSI
jgi:hypothetical protein